MTVGGHKERELIGVIIPTYNRCHFLQESLASVLSQSYRQLEILVIDNGSTDGTPELMASIIDPRVHYLVNEHNIGLAGSVNRGFSLFSKNVHWCTILCDDDLLDVNFIEVAVDTVERMSAQSIIYGRINFVDISGKSLRGSKSSPTAETAVDYLVNRLRCVRETYLTGVFVNCRAVLENGGYPQFKTGLACDDAFIFALGLRDRLYYANDAQVFVRVHEGAESQESGRISDHLQAINDFKSYILGRSELCTLPDSEARRLRKKLDIYSRQLRGIMWLRGIHFCLDMHIEKDNEHELDRLYGLVADSKELPFRVLIALFVRKRFAYNIEALLLYRKVCNGITRIFRRFIW